MANATAFPNRLSTWSAGLRKPSRKPRHFSN